jgi:hypothetical protein
VQRADPTRELTALFESAPGCAPELVALVHKWSAAVAARKLPYKLRQKYLDLHNRRSRGGWRCRRRGCNQPASPPPLVCVALATRLFPLKPDFAPTHPPTHPHPLTPAPLPQFCAV